MPAATHRSIIFLSSVQKELQAERRALKAFVHDDPLLSQFFEVLLFEDIPASGQRADQVYLAEVDRCDLYLGLFGQEYGYEDATGISPTEHEFDRATASGKDRRVFVIGPDATRHPKMQTLVRKASDQVVRRRVASTTELTAGLYAGLVELLASRGDIRVRPFDASACPGATLADLVPEKMDTFLAIARHKRGYAVSPGTPLADALSHLNLLDGDAPTHAAVLLFARAPQRFLLTSEVKCLHFHGTEVRKPIPSYQVFKGTAFELVDQAVDFVLGKLNRAVGTRAVSNDVPVDYEIPRDAVAEAVVNAIAHRDYTSHASVQVMLFSDRLEIWNPGRLPASLSFASLRRSHASVPRNPLLAEPLFLAGYIERAGTGTVDMIDLCTAAGLQPPEFRQDEGHFVQTLWRPAAPSTTQATQQATTQDKPLLSIALEELAVALGQPTTQVTTQVAEQVGKLLSAAAEPATREYLQDAVGLQNREHFRQTYLEPLLTARWMERTIPDKPTSRHQRYLRTTTGAAWLSRLPSTL
jgi:predicted HTH transcriptional regulator